MCDILVAHDASLLRELSQDRIGDLRPADQCHELRDGQQHRTVSVAVAQQRVHLEHRVLWSTRVAEEAVVDDPLEDGRRPDPHASFVPERCRRRRARLAGVTQRTDEVRFAEIGLELLAAVDAVVEGWVRRSVLDRCAAAGVEVDEHASAAIEVAAGRCRADVAARLERLLATDVDEQSITPLQILRAAVRHPTAVLVELGVAPVQRDDFERSAFPEDLYRLGPATFAEVDDSLTGPAIAWGAAKAHVHLARHRPAAR